MNNMKQKKKYKYTVPLFQGSIVKLGGFPIEILKDTIVGTNTKKFKEISIEDLLKSK